MSLRRLLLVLATVSLVQMGANFSCGKMRSIEITSPSGAVVNSCGVLVEFTLVATTDLSTLEATLNGQPLLLTGGGNSYSVLVDPGPSLIIDGSNELIVSVDLLGNGPISVSHTFDYVPPQASARVITGLGELIDGPLAHGQLGDYLLENGCARFIVQAPNQRDFNQVGAFGGNLIDAEIVENGVRRGNDNFWEIQPSLNVESVVNATTAQIVNDGTDSNPAQVDTCGPDDLLDGINASSAVVDAGGVPLSAAVDDKDYDINACTAYILARGVRHLELTTTVENHEATDVGLFIGDYVSGAGELEQWTPLPAGLALLKAGVGEMFANFAIDTLSYFGFDAAEGTDYALIPSPPVTTPRSSSFTTSGVSFVIHHYSIVTALFGGLPLFTVPAKVATVPGTNSFTRYFSVGDGSGSNAVAIQLELEGTAAGTLQSCVTIADGSDTPLGGARVFAARDQNGGTTNANNLRGHWVADDSGCVEGRLAAGDYFVGAAKQGYPYEGGGSTPGMTLVTVPAGGAVRHDVVLPETGRLRVEVTDESDSATPARIGVVGFDPSPPVLLPATLGGLIDVDSALIYDQNDGVPTGLSRTEFAGPSGIIEFDLEPGTYQIAVSRGNEYSLVTQQVTVTAGNTELVEAQVVRVLETPGFISSDYHVHLIDSPDSRISTYNRLVSMAAEGVENVIATDHSVVTNLVPAIGTMGFAPWLHSTPGEEVTSFDTGHYNAYPQGLDPAGIQTRGSTDWGGAAPPGMDFPIYGNYNLTPAEIEALVLADPDNAGLDTVVQINHIDSQFGPLKIDTSLTPPASVMVYPDDPEGFRLDPTILDFFHNFPALEVWNGMTIGHQNEFLVDRIGIWMNLLNRGFMTTAIADTDTHKFHNLRSGGARTWTPSSTDTPASIVDNEIGQAVKAGKATGGQGIFVLARLEADSTGETTGLGLGDATINVTVPVVPPKVVSRPGVTTTDGEVHVDIDIQAPAWAPYDTIEIYTNSATTVAGTNGGVPVLFGAIADQTLTLGAGDFTVASVDKSPPGPTIPGASRLETQKRVTLTGLTEDTWVVVLVKGTDGVSPPMFPVHVSGLNLTQNPTLGDLETVIAGEDGIRALGFANALFVDMDGNPGFDPPITP